MNSNLKIQIAGLKDTGREVLKDSVEMNFSLELKSSNLDGNGSRWLRIKTSPKQERISPVLLKWVLKNEWIKLDFNKICRLITEAIHTGQT